MAHPNFSRRNFIKLLTTLLLSGCTPPTEPEGVATSMPPTRPPTAEADVTAQAYLGAWEQGDYSTMFSLLTPEARIRLKQARTLQQYYTQPLLTATVEQVETRLKTLLYEGPQAAMQFEAVWHTVLFGSLTIANQMQLRFVSGRWSVVWQPTLVLPQLGEGITLRFIDEQSTRGNIYDTVAHALATQGEMVTVGVIPQQLENKPMALKHLASITEVAEEKMQTAIEAARPDWFVPVAEIDFAKSLQYDELFNSIPGVERRAYQVRAYPDGQIASHLIGYMGPIPADEKAAYLRQGYKGDELVGLMGLERWAEPELAGQRGGRLVTVSPAQRVLTEIATAETRSGSSITLTLDTAFQARVENLLGERLGSVVVMNPQDGTIYAMASFPRFRPAVFTPGFDIQAWVERYTNETRPLVNRATQGLYPPGSIFKIVTTAAALEMLGAQPEDSFFCSGVWMGLGEQFAKKCWQEQGHGPISMIDGLTQSCDVVFYELGLKMHRENPQLLPEWAHHFGLGQSTNIVGLVESAGVIPTNEWTQANFNQPYFDGDAVNSAIGQGYTLSTPLQVARMLAAVGNGGQLVIPRLIQRIVPVNGEAQQFEPQLGPQLPLSTENLAIIRQSLQDVVSEGTARRAFQGVSYQVAGKTGTSESGQEVPHAWFAGYAPHENPQVVIAVVLEHAGEGSLVAAPLFRQVLEAFFEWQATPDNPVPSLAGD